MPTVICFAHTGAADADVVGATEELQGSLVDGTQRQGRTRAAQSVPVKSGRPSERAEINRNRTFEKVHQCTGAVVCGRMAAGHHACCW